MTDHRDLVSIVIANFNYGRYLGESIQSALDQTYQNIEILVVDDGSTDESLEVAARYPVQVFARPHEGVSAARNHGASQSQGKFLLFLDSDDILEPNAVERLLSALKMAPPKIAYVYCQVRHFGCENHINSSREFSARALVCSTFVSIASLIRKPLFEAIGGWDPRWTDGHEDAEFWVRMLHHGYHGLLLPEPLYRYRRHGPSLNTLDERKIHFLNWRMIATYPRLHWRKVLKHPFKYLYYAITLGKSRIPHGPRPGQAPGPFRG